MLDGPKVTLGSSHILQLPRVCPVTSDRAAGTQIALTPTARGSAWFVNGLMRNITDYTSSKNGRSVLIGTR